MKYSAFALPLALMLAAGTVSAAEPINKQVKLVGTIPTEFFNVIDSGNWWGKNHELSWVEGEGFALFKQRLIFVSTVGAVTAHLTLPAQLTNDKDDVIAMRLRVAGKTLSTLPQEVASAEEMLTGKPFMVDFDLSADSTAMPAPGDYSGVFGMMFETKAPL
ncbi:MULTISPECIES: fimbrial protein [unclassified Pseudomonas]|uniref:fimbrial protein n=1 Tax=unclassified Pseudomonas TaxID=196821 RepID=UPI0021C965AD|nr:MULTISPECIES: fimbrial protein [unclassified Pseudomonas]MCU1733031.1 fimbrial protein [Pseudomonas sp. 20P_3.2_Bac4]MCU1744132.1 fimbrial protein [Pseudomonas sp. 20P_3.2_Bac5]